MNKASKILYVFHAIGAAGLSVLMFLLWYTFKNPGISAEALLYLILLVFSPLIYFVFLLGALLGKVTSRAVWLARVGVVGAYLAAAALSRF